MKSRTARLVCHLFSVLWLLSSVPWSARAQSANAAPHRDPDAAELHLLGLVATEAEAAPLLAQYDKEKRQLLQERIAAYASMQGKSTDEQLKIWHTLVESQRDRLAKHRELEHRLSAVLKQEREKHLPAKTKGEGK